MASEPPSPQPVAPPPQPAAPPPPPAPGASREEWRAWKHQERDYWREQRHPGGWYGSGPWVGPWGWWGGGWFWGAVLILIGVYYFAQNLGWLDRIPGNVLWPSLLILLGVWLLIGRGRGWMR